MIAAEWAKLRQGERLNQKPISEAQPTEIKEGNANAAETAFDLTQGDAADLIGVNRTSVRDAKITRNSLIGRAAAAEHLKHWRH